MKNNKPMSNRASSRCKGHFKRWIPIGVLIALLVALSGIATCIGPSPVEARPSREFEVPVPRDEDEMVVSLVMLEEDIGGLNHRISSMEEESESLDDEIAGLDTEISRETSDLRDQQAVLNKRVRAMYMKGRASVLGSLLESEDITDFLTLLDYLERVADSDTQLIGRIKSKVTRITNKKASLKDKHAENDEIMAALKQKRSRLVEQRDQKKQLLAQAGDSRAQVENRATSVRTKMVEIQPVPIPASPGSSKTMQMRATAYCALEPGLGPGTATGMPARKGVIAVDPRVIPLGTRVYVHGYGYAIAGDTGSAIKGNKIDLCYDTLEEMNGWSTRVVTVEILD